MRKSRLRVCSIQIFYNYTPQRDCVDTTFNSTEGQCDITEEQQCQALRNCSNITVEDPPFHSMVEEYNLYCDKAYDATLVSVNGFEVFFLGMIKEEVM